MKKRNQMGFFQFLFRLLKDQRGEVVLPEWLQLIQDEQVRNAVWEKAKTGWLEGADYTQKTQKLSEQQKAWEAAKADYDAKLKAWDDWHKTQFTPMYNFVSPHWEDIQKFVAGKTNGTNRGTAPANPGHNTDPNAQYWENWDLLTPAQQAQKQADYFRENVLKPALTERDKSWKEEIDRREAGYQRYLDYQNYGFTQLAKNPQFPLQEFLNNALKFTYGQFDPKEMALKATTSEGDLKKQQEEWKTKWREEWDLEQKNKNQSPEVITSGILPSLIKSAPVSDADREASVRQAAAEKGIAW